MQEFERARKAKQFSCTWVLSQLPKCSITPLSTSEVGRALERWWQCFVPLFKGESLWIYLISTIFHVVLTNIVWLKSAWPKVALYTKSRCKTYVYWYSLNKTELLGSRSNVKRVAKNQTFDHDTFISYTEYYANDYITTQASAGKLHIINID